MGEFFRIKIFQFPTAQESQQDEGPGVVGRVGQIVSFDSLR